MTAITLREWLDATEVAADELATMVLNLRPSQLQSSNDGGIPAGLSGSFIALVADDDSVLLNLSSNMDGLAQLAKSMLGMGAEEVLSDADLCDAVGEMANITAGSIKRQLTDRTSGIKLGLPTFIQGRVAHGDSQENGVVSLMMGPVPVHISVTKKKTIE